MKYTDLGKKIKALRESRKFTKQEFAEKLGYQSDTAIHLIERGKRKLSIDKLMKVAEIFEISISELITENTEIEKLNVVTALRSDGALDEEDIDQISSFIDFIKQKGTK